MLGLERSAYFNVLTGDSSLFRQQKLMSWTQLFVDLWHLCDTAVFRCDNRNGAWRPRQRSCASPCPTKAENGRRRYIGTPGV